MTRLPNIHRHRRIGERRVNIVDRNGVEGVCGVAAYIDDHAKAPLFTRADNLLPCDKRGDPGREVNAVDKNINVKDFLEWPAFGRLVHIPFDNVISI